MEYDFKSGFAAQLCEFVNQKKAVGFSYNQGVIHLINFDKLCYEQIPQATQLTWEVCNLWAIKKSTEKNNTFRNRLSSLREFAKYIIRNGGEAYVIPINMVRKSPRHQPYIYSTSEVSAIWNEFDSLNSTKAYPAKQVVLSAIVRILYCTGLRPCEARKLKINDVDLATGKLFIRESKGHKDRIVMLSDSLTQYLCKYDYEVKKHFPFREWFFPNVRGGFCRGSWINDNFLHVCQRLKICGIDGNVPRMYDLRHTMATHRLYDWMKSGVNIHEKIQYLSRYMGHSQLSDTFYYIHLVPEQIETLAGIDISYYEDLLPEVAYDD